MFAGKKMKNKTNVLRYEETVTFRVRPVDKAQLLERAEKYGLKPSEYLRGEFVKMIYENDKGK